MQEAGASLAERWPGLKARRAQSSIKNARWPNSRRKNNSKASIFRVMPKAWRNPPRHEISGKVLWRCSLRWGWCCFSDLRCIALRRCQSAEAFRLKATQSALTFEGAQGDVFSATRGRYSRETSLTAADLPPHLAQAIIAIEDRRFLPAQRYRSLGNTTRPAGAIRRPAAPARGGSTITQQLARP